MVIDDFIANRRAKLPKFKISSITLLIVVNNNATADILILVLSSHKQNFVVWLAKANLTGWLKQYIGTNLATGDPAGTSHQVRQAEHARR